MNRYINLEMKICKELSGLEEKYRTGAEMSEGDLRRLDLLAHSAKCLATYVAMKEAEESQEMSRMERMPNDPYMNNSYNMGNSYQTRDNMGRYVSNDMTNDMSGHIRNIYPYDRRW